MMIDRAIQPRIRPVEKPLLVEPVKVILDNGVPVYQLNAGTQDVCKIDFIFGAGSWQQQIQLQAGLTNAMLQEGSVNYRAEVIAEKIDFHGAWLQLMADQHQGTISIVTLTRHLPQLMPVIEEMVRKSVFPVREFETLVARRKQRFLLENEKVKVLSQKKFSEALFGEGHPYAQTVKEEDFDSIQRESLIGFYHSYYHSGNCEILIAGRFDESLTGLVNTCFGRNDWKNDAALVRQSPIPRPSFEKKLFVNKPGAIQSAIRVGKMMVRKTHPDYLPLQVLVTILGGYFSSRLMTSIREEKGYTYGIGAHLVSMRHEGYLVIATEVDKRYEQATLDGIFRELGKLREEPVTKEELERVRQYLLGEFLRELDGPFAWAQAFLNVHEFGLGYDFYEKYYRTIVGISPEQLKHLAEMYFQEETFYTIIAGRETL